MDANLKISLYALKLVQLTLFQNKNSQLKNHLLILTKEFIIQWQSFIKIIYILAVRHAKKIS